MSGYIDLHCDTLWMGIHKNQPDIARVEGSMLDIERLRESGVMAQFFAMFLPQNKSAGWSYGDHGPDLDETLQKLYEIFQNTLKACSNMIRFAGSYSDLMANEKEGYMSALLTVENGEIIHGKMDRIQMLYDMGVRLVGLTWNDPNCLGYNNSKDPDVMSKGLTAFGKEAVERMNELGIIVDVSHLSDGGFYDVAAISKRPFIASHSNCRSLTAHPRNLTDEMIRILAEHGGVSGLNFCPMFLDSDPQAPLSSVEAMCDHVMHLINKGGIECVAIGTDFDGISGKLEIDNCLSMDRLFDALKKRGLSDDHMDRFRYGNVMRVIKDTLG